MLTIIKSKLLIDGIQDEALEDALIVIKDDKIEYAGKFTEELFNTYKKEEHEYINASDKTVMPGLIDAHIHLTMYGGPHNMTNFLMDTAAFTAYKAEYCARKCLESGFTTVRSLGDKAEVDIGLKQAINEGWVVGPRVLSSGKCITMTGGHGDLYPGDVELDSIGEVCDGVDEVRRAARKRLKYDCDCIKLMATGGGNSAGPGTVAQLNEDEMRAAVIEANKRGKITAAHCIGTDGIKNAIRAGVRTIEHGTFLDDEAIQMLLDYDAYLVPTLCAFRTIKYGEEAGVPPHVIEKVQHFATEHYSNLEKAIKAGVKIVCGTDTGTPFNYHGQGAEEIAEYTKYGLTPMQAIKTATSVAAQALFQHDIGSLEKGKTADLIIVKGNPVENIECLQDIENVKYVMRNGKVLVTR